MEDSQIVAMYLQRSEDAIFQTAVKYGAYCQSIARSILPDPEDAKECVNDTYYAAWNSIPPHRPAHLAPYLGKITRRLAINLWERNHAAKRGGGQVPLALEELEECVGATAEPLAQLQQEQLRQCLNTFLHALPDAPRRVFICRYYHLDSIEDIGLRFGFSQSKVKSMLHRTRQKLQAQLKKEGFVP